MNNQLIHLNGVNIVIHPHSPDAYVEAFSKAITYSKANPIRLPNNNLAYISSMQTCIADSDDHYLGDIVEYTPPGPADISKAAAASSSDPSKPSSAIPITRHNFYLNQFRHSVVLSSYTYGENARMIAFLNEVISKANPSLAVYVGPLIHKSATEAIDQIQSITRIEYSLFKPDPSSLVLEKPASLYMEEHSFMRMSGTIIPSDPVELSLDSRTYSIILASVFNGYVKINGLSDMGKPIRFRSLNYSTFSSFKTIRGWSYATAFTHACQTFLRSNARYYTLKCPAIK